MFEFCKPKKSCGRPGGQNDECHCFILFNKVSLPFWRQPLYLIAGVVCALLAAFTIPKRSSGTALVPTFEFYAKDAAETRGHKYSGWRQKRQRNSVKNI